MRKFSSSTAKLLKRLMSTALEDGEIIIYMAKNPVVLAPQRISDLLHVEDSLTQVLRSISMQNFSVFHVNHALVSSET